MQGVCERFLRFLVGENPDLVVCDCSGGGGGVADEIGDSDAPVAVAEQMHALDSLNETLKFVDAVEVTDFVLR